MKLIYYYITMNIRRQYIYGKNLAGEFILSLCYYLIQFIFIDQISSFSNGLGNYSREEVHLIFIVFVLLGLLLSIFTNSIEVFFDKVADGKIEVYLTKPISIWFIMLLGWCKPLNIINFIILCAFAYIFVDFPDKPYAEMNWFSFIIALCCIIIINICFFMIFNFMTFITNRKMPVEYFHEMIYELSFVPISLYPSAIVKWLIFILPMAFSASLPISLLLEKNEWRIEYLLFSTLFVISLTYVTYRGTITKFNGLGG
ncbi:ABC-2 family transporter protein [Pectobacterium brasiliense]|uniref:ABC-2 family transporter protein n=1 Tax=Pectobacterium brasiliense TaxID=180957 RepID=UPI000AE6293E|nr:ABC-2 family transporter protein [Pectobacterium brasiliense]